jgi:hypothetical protein
VYTFLIGAASGYREHLSGTKPVETDEREASPYKASVQITTIYGEMRWAILHTVNRYTFIALASVHEAKQILEGTYRSGFQTPDEILGHDFVKAIRGTEVLDGFRWWGICSDRCLVAMRSAASVSPIEIVPCQRS